MKNTKRALFSSVVALILCFSMLVGTTFAWFTDEVESGVNKIVAGNLDVELEYKNVKDGTLAADWTTVQGASEIFDPNALWEPGRVEVVYLKVSNLGTLSLKYQMGVNFEETPGVNVDGEDLYLSQHLVFKVVELADEPTAAYTREEAIAAAGTEKGIADYDGETTEMTAGDYDYVALIVYMPEEVGNEANYRGEAVPTITLGVNLYATQLAAEEDSFGPDYDEDAFHPNMTVYNAADLQAAMVNGGNIKLGADIELTEAWTPVGTAEEPFTGSINGNGYTISGLTVSGVSDAALIAYAGENVTVKNLTLENVSINSTKYAAGVVCNAGTGLVVENVTVSGTINADSYAGGLVFDADKVTIKNCQNNADVTAGRASGIASWISNATVENVVNTGDISGTYSAAGIANRFSGTMKYATNNGTIIGEGTEATAGIAGIQLGVSTYEYCVNNGDVTSTADNANASAAGILGQTPGTKATLNYCINTGAITADASYAAGIAYSLYGSVTANYCYNSGDVYGGDAAGGITPKAQYGSGDKANYCVVDASVTSAGKVYPICNNAATSYYYDVDTLKTNAGVEITAKAAKAALDAQTGGVFFKVVNGRLVAALDYNWVGDLRVATVAELQAALDAADAGENYIVLTADITGDVTATQKENVKITIDGNNKTFNGSITVDGKSKRYETAALTIQNLNFAGVSGKDTVYINLGKSGDTNTRYTNNVTVKDCTFTGTGNETAAVKSYTGGDWNLTLDGLTVDAGMHSMLQVTNVEKGLKIVDCKVYSKNGINLNNTPSLEMSGCEFDVTGYAVRFGVGGSTLNGNFLIENSTLASECNDGDAVIIFRGNVGGSTLNLKNTDITGSLEMKGHEKATIIIDGIQIVKAPIEVPVAPLEEDFLFPAGTNAVIYKDMVMSGDAQITHTENAVLGLSNVEAELDHNVIIRKSGGAIVIENSNFTLTNGAKLISVGEGGDAHQVFLINVWVNGELLTDANAGQYLEGISWFGAYPEWPQEG